MMECQPSFIRITVKSWQFPWFHIFALYLLEEKLVIFLLPGIKDLGEGMEGGGQRLSLIHI